jgi:hypothetical protein
MLSATFAWDARFPMEFGGTINVLETTLHQWAELQGKELNEAANVNTVNMQNVLDVTNWEDAKLVVEWYAYGDNDPLQRLTLERVKITGYEGSLAVAGRKESVWTIRSDGNFLLEGLSDGPE